MPLPFPKKGSAASRRTWLAWVPAPVLTAGFLWGGLGATRAHHGLPSLVGVTLLYALLALTLVLAARFAVRAGHAWGVLACLGLALVPAAQLRLDAGLLERTPVCAGFVLLVGGLTFALLRAGLPREPRCEARSLGQAYLALGALLACAFLGTRLSAELRWHLLKHHRLFGTWLYALDARPLLVERDGLWRRAGSLSQPAEHVLDAPAAPVVFDKPPHIVFVLVDTLRADGLAALGGAHNVMPATNALVERSLLFEDLHANASWTRASCASIFTGLLPEEHGAARFHERLAESWVTLPEQMTAAGYQTAAFIANWVQVGRETGFAQGFAEADFHQLMNGDELLERAGREAGEREVRGAYARAETLNRKALEWLESDARDPYRPLFLYLHYLDPHSPYLEPPEPGTLADPHERKRGLYRQQLRYFDRQLASFLTDLETRLSGPKIVILTSDHGEEFWEHDDWGHGHSLHDELVHVPLFVHFPDGRAGRIATPLESRDLYAMVQDLVRDPELDLAAWARAHARATRYASQYLDRDDDARADRKWTGLRRVDEDGWSLIWSAYGRTLELYDEHADPEELENRIDFEPARAQRMQHAMARAVRFWSQPLSVERTPQELEALRRLGYVGGVDVHPGTP